MTEKALAEKTLSDFIRLLDSLDEIEGKDEDRLIDTIKFIRLDDLKNWAVAIIKDLDIYEGCGIEIVKKLEQMFEIKESDLNG